jgi:uncharacterized membrane protein YjjB (DUF3815 family)
MFGLSLLAALLSLALALRPPAPIAAQARLAVFASGTLAVALAFLHVSARTRAWPPAAALGLAWVLLRALTRPDRPPRQSALAAAAVVVGVLASSAIAAYAAR